MAVIRRADGPQETQAFERAATNQSDGRTWRTVAELSPHEDVREPTRQQQSSCLPSGLPIHLPTDEEGRNTSVREVRRCTRPGLDDDDVFLLPFAGQERNQRRLRPYKTAADRLEGEMWIIELRPRPSTFSSRLSTTARQLVSPRASFRSVSIIARTRFSPSPPSTGPDVPATPSGPFEAS